MNYQIFTSTCFQTNAKPQPVVVVRLVDNKYNEKDWDDQFFSLGKIGPMIDRFETDGYGKVVWSGGVKGGDPIVCRNVREIIPDSLYICEVWGGDSGWETCTIREQETIPPGMKLFPDERWGW
jgi:hypothetical protein